MSKPLLKLFASCDPSPDSCCTSTTGGDNRRERELDRISGTAKAKTVPVGFASFVKLLSQAIHDDAAWLDDFAEDTIQIDADLHDVLMTYQQLRQRRAA